jgi:penicillin amidase
MKHADKEVEKLGFREKEILLSYCQGVDRGLSDRYPWELKLMGVKPEKWNPEDTVMISRMIGFLTLSQSQGEMERLFVEMVQAGISQDKLNELFPGILNEFDPDLIKKITLQERIVPPHILWNIAVPRMMASNNWVISGSKTQSGKPILANDPHLETNRLPNVWCEMAATLNGQYVMGASMPGTPGILVGRNADLAWGATYSFADAIDSWIEQCRDGKYYREGRWETFRTRTEIIHRKKKNPVTVIFYENDHGVLDGDPRQDGYYLATRWASAASGSASLTSVIHMRNAATVTEGMNHLGKLETSWNWVLADSQGNIGYQMSGLVPKRRNGISGFVPLPGWEPKNDWQDFVAPENLPRCLNPEQGYFVTANNDLNAYGVVSPINMPMGDYRAVRIAAEIESAPFITVNQMFKLHYDVVSVQAEKFMKILKPLLPDTPQGKILMDWDYTYAADSKGAFLFEEFYKALNKTVFGTSGMGETVVDYLNTEAGTFTDFYANFDRIMLSENSVWFAGQHRNQIFQNAARQALQIDPLPWGQVRQITLNHILFGGKLPGFLGFDKGPITMIGGRATPHQGQIYRSGGRTTTFCPSFRMVADLSEDTLHTNMAGGPSDRRFSKWYVSDMFNWINGKYKSISAVDDTRLPFP